MKPYNQEKYTHNILNKYKDSGTMSVREQLMILLPLAPFIAILIYQVLKITK